MAGGYRYHCGECDHRTAWLTESQGEEQHLRHYLSRHAGILPGGWKESAPPRTGGGAGGCLGVLGGVFLILVLASTCEAGAAVPPVDRAAVPPVDRAAVPPVDGPTVSPTVEHRPDPLR